MVDTFIAQEVMIKVIMITVKAVLNYELNSFQKIFICLFFKSKMIKIFKSCSATCAPS